MMTQSNLTSFDDQKIPEGYKKTEVGIIPSSWKYTTIRSVTVSHKQGYYSTESYSNSGIKLARITDLKNPEIDFESMPLLSVSEKDYNFYKIKVGDILLARSGAIGRYGIVRKAEIAVFASYIIRFSLDNSQIDNDYFGYVYQSENVQKQLLTITQGSSNININAGNIKSLEVLLPDLDEQKKIATALSDTDTLISELEKLIEKKQAIKTATMQQLLTGKTRLPEFALREDGTSKGYKDSELGQIPEDWGIVPFRECVDIPQGQVNPINEPYASMILVGPKHIESGTGKLLFVETANEQQAISGKYLFEEGDVLYGKINPYLMKAALVNFKGLCSADMYPLRPKGNIKSGLLLALILGEDFKKYAVSVSARSGMPKINRNELAQYKFCLPKDLEEQEKIANILLSIDVGLESLNTHLNKINNIKKGMMQELLTGKTRLV